MPCRSASRTNYPGVYYREAERIGGRGTERVYYVVFKRDGRTIEEKVGRQYADDMTPARASGIRNERIEGKRKSRKQIREEQEAQRQAEADRWTFARLWAAYKEARPNLKGIVTDENRYTLHIAPDFGGKTPSEVAPLDIDRLRVKLSKKLAPGTVRNVLELLRRLVNFARKKNLCEIPGRLRIELPKGGEARTEDLNPDQLAALLAAMDTDPNIQAANLMRLALFTGMRRGELFRLEWRDLDFDRGFIQIRGPKGGKDAKIPMSEATRALLKSHPQVSGSVYVFPGRNGGKRVDITKTVNRIKRRAGLPEDFRALHGLRHAYASMLASSGKVDMYTLQKLMTHKSPLMTQRYAHLRDEAMKRAADVAGDIVAEAANGKTDNKVVNLGDHRKA